MPVLQYYLFYTAVALIYLCNSFHYLFEIFSNNSIFLIIIESQKLIRFDMICLNNLDKMQGFDAVKQAQIIITSMISMALIEIYMVKGKNQTAVHNVIKIRASRY